ncbi:MAG: hypothetical protein DRP18_03830 [Candidatus Aenigmatarchaeota archaeon]|nr:MAG: hypothetical protein DRP18_03830 [Candidatus Aenigmarchaeota archaeon]
MNIGSELKKEPDVKGFFNYLKTPEAREEIEELVSALPWHVSGLVRNEIEAAIENRNLSLFCMVYKMARGYLEWTGKKGFKFKEI